MNWGLEFTGLLMLFIGALTAGLEMLWTDLCFRISTGIPLVVFLLVFFCLMAMGLSSIAWLVYNPV